MITVMFSLTFVGCNSGKSEKQKAFEIKLYCGNCRAMNQNTIKLAMVLATPTKPNLINLCRKGNRLIHLRNDLI
jgi:hypothetical protein